MILLTRVVETEQLLVVGDDIRSIWPYLRLCVPNELAEQPEYSNIGYGSIAHAGTVICGLVPKVHWAAKILNDQLHDSCY